MTQFIISGLLIYIAQECEIQVNLRNPAKVTKACKILQNSVENSTNTCRYNIFETYHGYWGRLTALNLQIYHESSSPQQTNKVPKLPGVNYVAKNWALVMMLKALPLSNNFLKRFVFKIANDYLC